MKDLCKSTFNACIKQCPPAPTPAPAS
jgi:hypothetical protein